MLKRFLSHPKSRRPTFGQSGHRDRAGQLGFTLIELLVSMIIAGIIVTGLLYLVVELLATDNRESARSNTQRDAQMALDFITEELREAVYVYDNIEKLTGTGDYSNRNASIPTDIGTPILAFWKPVDLDVSLLTPDCTNPTGDIRCDLLSRRHSYSLVVYYQSTANPNDIWEGESRIIRYELSEFDPDNQPTNQANRANLNYTDGYVNPTSSNLNPNNAAAGFTSFSSFVNWPYTSNPDVGNTAIDLRGNDPPAINQPLVDFIDAPGLQATRNDPNIAAPIFASNFANAANPEDFCPDTTTTITDENGNTTQERVYQLSTNDINASQSFFACVRRNDLSTSVNQDVYLYLRANANGRVRPDDNPNNDVLLPLTSQVLIRGIESK